LATHRTIGYEAASADAFLATLRDAGVTCVLDVRAVPISRKRGFSKNVLRDRLYSKGIGYVHIGALGNPKPGREAAKSGWTSEFHRIYRKHLHTRDAQAGLREAAEYASAFAACLLCFERDAATCHRSMVALELASRYNFTVEHLTVAGSETSFGPKPRRRSPDPGQSRTSPEPALW
jgi:uncharacterized protein (DUF488 family)